MMEMRCRVCGAITEPAGEKVGRLHPRVYHLRHCANCGFSFVADPDRGAHVYDEQYYRGGGADPLLDYVFELEHPEATVRRWEWSGVERIIRSLRELTPQTRWLDYGCGNGGLVRWVNERTQARCSGFEEGWIADRARDFGIPVLTEDEMRAGAPYDVITAIEVIEHVEDPAGVARRIAELLAPGGVFFYTTGNAALHAGALTKWSYVAPEIHVSFFEPRTMERILTEAGLVARSLPWSRGFEEIVAFKVLKNLGQRRFAPWQRVLAWGPLARAAERIGGISAFPAGIKP